MRAGDWGCHTARLVVGGGVVFPRSCAGGVARCQIIFVDQILSSKTVEYVFLFTCFGRGSVLWKQMNDD